MVCLFDHKQFFIFSFPIPFNFLFIIFCLPSYQNQSPCIKVLLWGSFFAAKLLTPNMPLCKGQILITLCLTFINQTFLSVCLCAGKLDQSTIGHNKATISSTKSIWNYILCTVKSRVLTRLMQTFSNCL